MSNISLYRHQRGATLIVALIMLLLFTVVVSGAWNIGLINLKAVGNQQSRDEAVASANAAIDQVLQSNFTSTPCPEDYMDTNSCVESVQVDVNNDGVNDYTARVAKLCVAQKEIIVPAGACEEDLLAMCTNPWLTVWELRATVNDPVSGAFTVARTGVNMLLTVSERLARCI